MILGVVLSLSGCAVPVIMAANVAAAEAFSSGINPETEVSGVDVFAMGRWDKKTERTTYSILGIGDWTCANKSSGGSVCIPTAENIEEINNEQVSFSCEIGQGGMVSQLVSSKNATTLFCKKISSGQYASSDASKQAPMDKRELVREVQTMLSQKGYNPGPIDGQEGSSTRSALRKFQKTQSLPITKGITEEAYTQLASDNKKTHSISDARECVRNFEKKSGGLRSYGTTVMLDGVAPTLATKRLVRALARDGYTVNNSQGLVSGIFDVGSSSLKFSAFIDKKGKGSEVELNLGAQKVSLGMMAMSEDVYRSDLCEYVVAMRRGG